MNLLSEVMKEAMVQSEMIVYISNQLMVKIGMFKIHFWTLSCLHLIQSSVVDEI